METNETSSEVSTTSSSRYFQRRYDGRTTRRKALEKLGRNQRVTGSSEAVPYGQDEQDSGLLPNSMSQTHDVSDSTPAEAGATTSEGQSGSGLGAGGSFRMQGIVDSGEHHLAEDPSTQDEHDTDELEYFKVVYMGVVALLSEPNKLSPRNGEFVRYGDIIVSSKKLIAGSVPLHSAPLTPTRQSASNDYKCRNFRKDSEAPEMNDFEAVVVRVDKILTGTTQSDGTWLIGEVGDKTPKRTNIQPNSSMIVMPSASTRNSQEASTCNCHGYIFSHRKSTQILLPLEKVPVCDQGSFRYKVISSTPLPIVSGPCVNAPRTKGVLIPGSVHEICLRLSVFEGSGWFLRLTRQRGWVSDRKSECCADGKGMLLMEEVVSETRPPYSLTPPSTSIRITAGPVVSRKHHRLPRRLQGTKSGLAKHPSKTEHGMGQQSVLPADTSRHDSDVNQSLEKVVMSPSSNVSLLSDDSSFDHQQNYRHGNSTPDRSIARSTASSTNSHTTYFLMRVNAPRGLGILDAPHFQVNNLIRRNHPIVVQAHSPMTSKDFPLQSGNQSIFQTMAGHHTTTLTSRISNPAVFDSITKARKLPRGSLFEASKRMEASSSFNQGAGLIKLSDNSGWAIVPHQEELDDQYRSNSGALLGIKEGEATRAFEEVGNAVVDDQQPPLFCRVVSRGGVVVSLPPIGLASSDGNTSPSSSVAENSSIEILSQIHSRDSDVASSVGSSFLDAMFRTPARKNSEQQQERKRDSSALPKIQMEERVSTVIQCGMFAEVDRWVDPPERARYIHKIDFLRLRGGQGWLPRYMNGRPTLEIISPPESRIGSFWFRVKHLSGIKVRVGPSKRAPSIKSDEGVYFRFECGEFLRASEIVTFYHQGVAIESFAKLYRNRHVSLQKNYEDIRSLASLTSPAEWAEVFGSEGSYLLECSGEPRIERHRQGWRYNVVLDARILVRKGPSFEADTNGVVLLGGESVLINERVIGPHDTVTWLRLKDGQGWVHNLGKAGEVLMIPHSLRHRKVALGAPSKKEKGSQEDVAYNAIIARLFHSDISETGSNPKR